MPARPFVLHLISNIAQRLLDLLRWQARILQPLRAIRNSVSIDTVSPDLMRNTGVAFAS